MQVRMAPVSEGSDQLASLTVTPKPEAPTPFTIARAPPWPQLLSSPPESPPPSIRAPPTRHRPHSDQPRAQSRKRDSPQTHAGRPRMPARLGLLRSGHPSLTHQRDDRTKAAAGTSWVCACARGRPTTSPRGQRAHFRSFPCSPRPHPGQWLLRSEYESGLADPCRP